MMWGGDEAKRSESREPDIILGTTLGTHGAIVIVQEPPNPLHPIGLLLCFQLEKFVHPNVLRKLMGTHRLSSQVRRQATATQSVVPLPHVLCGEC
jgi:hypothetical protein